MKVVIIGDKSLCFKGGIKRDCDELYGVMCGCDVDVMGVEEVGGRYVKWIGKYK